MGVRLPNVKINYSKTYYFIMTRFYEKIFSTPKEKYEKKFVAITCVRLVADV